MTDVPFRPNGEASQQQRRAEIAANLSEVQDRIDQACRDCSRDPAEVRLVVVTKTFPASDLDILADLGCRDIAENRDQEARRKSTEVPAEIRHRLRWHMIGQLQRNKARSVAGWADVVESVDRIAAADALHLAAVGLGRVLDVLIQVCLDEVQLPGRGGVPVADALALAEHCRGLPNLTLVGVMGVAPHPGDPEAAFTRLAEVRADLAGRYPGIREMSAGMSLDLEAAIKCGATQVRIGGAVLGKRVLLK